MILRPAEVVLAPRSAAWVLNDFGDLNDPNTLQFQQGGELNGIPRQFTLNVTRGLVRSLTRASQPVRANRRGRCDVRVDRIEVVDGKRTPRGVATVIIV